MWKLPVVPPGMPNASVGPSESLEYLLRYYKVIGRMAAASAVDFAVTVAVTVAGAGAGADAAAAAAAAAAVANYGRKRVMGMRAGDCAQIAEHLDIVERTNC